jgi:hypothetical protein
MMSTISNNSELHLAIEQIGRLYAGIAALRKRTGRNPKNFALLAEGALEQVRQIQNAIDEYAGAHEISEAEAPIWLRMSGPGIPCDFPNHRTPPMSVNKTSRSLVQQPSNICALRDGSPAEIPDGLRILSLT